MAGIGKLTILVSLSILLLTSRMLQVSSAQEEPPNISEAKDKSTGVAGDNGKIVVQKKGMQVPYWQIIRGLKVAAKGSDSPPDGLGH